MSGLISSTIPGARPVAGSVTDLIDDPGLSAALLLDIDGTLLDIAETPDSVVVPDGLGALLDRLRLALGGALALVSGRSLAQIDGLFHPYRFAAAGQHGAELRQADTGMVAAFADPRLETVRAFARQVEGDHQGVLVEDKGFSIAFHYRQVPELERTLRLGLALALGGHTDLEMMTAKMAFDIKPRGLDKGTAIAWLMARPPFAGRRPIFLGDDVTDRFGMQAAKLAGGVAIQVGPAPLQHSEIFEDFTLASPQAVRAWLSDFADRLEQHEEALGP